MSICKIKKKFDQVNTLLELLRPCEGPVKVRDLNLNFFSFMVNPLSYVIRALGQEVNILAQIAQDMCRGTPKIQSTREILTFFILFKS